MALFFPNSPAYRPEPHPAEVPSNGVCLDDLPLELIQLICSKIHADRSTVVKRLAQPRYGPQGSMYMGNFTQYARTLGRLCLASKRYRQIALPYLYSYISVGDQDAHQLPIFISLLCRNPGLRALVKEIDIKCLPRAFVVTQDMGDIFDNMANELDYYTLPSWDPNECPERCSVQCHPCIHFKRLLMLLFLLTPNLNRLSMIPPNQFYFSDVGDATWRAVEGSKMSPSISPIFTSLQHLWVPGAQPLAVGLTLSAQEIGLQLSGWLVPSLLTLRLRHACMFHPIPAAIRLDNLREIVLDVALSTAPGLFSLVSACPVLEGFYFHSRGSSQIFPDGFGNDSLGMPPPSEFTPEDIVPAFAHLTGTLRHLAIDLWDGARGGADYNISFNTDNGELYSSWPNWRGDRNLIGSLKSFTTLETLKLDSSCLFHYSPANKPIPDLPSDHLTQRLPRSLRHLVLPGAPSQMISALYALASASKEFPALKLVEITSDEKDQQKRRISIRKYGEMDYLVDNFTKFLNMEQWSSLEKAFEAAGIKLIHIDSGNTSCFATERLLGAGLSNFRATQTS